MGSSGAPAAAVSVLFASAAAPSLPARRLPTSELLGNFTLLPALDEPEAPPDAPDKQHTMDGLHRLLLMGRNDGCATVSARLWTF